MFSDLPGGTIVPEPISAVPARAAELPKEPAKKEEEEEKTAFEIEKFGVKLILRTLPDVIPAADPHHHGRCRICERRLRRNKIKAFRKLKKCFVSRKAWPDDISIAVLHMVQAAPDPTRVAVVLAPVTMADIRVGYAEEHGALCPWLKQETEAAKRRRIARAARRARCIAKFLSCEKGERHLREYLMKLHVLEAPAPPSEVGAESCCGEDVADEWDMSDYVESDLEDDEKAEAVGANFADDAVGDNGKAEGEYAKLDAAAVKKLAEEYKFPEYKPATAPPAVVCSYCGKIITGAGDLKIACECQGAVYCSEKCKLRHYKGVPLESGIAVVAHKPAHDATLMLKREGERVATLAKSITPEKAATTPFAAAPDAILFGANDAAALGMQPVESCKADDDDAQEIAETLEDIRDAELLAVSQDMPDLIPMSQLSSKEEGGKKEETSAMPNLVPLDAPLAFGKSEEKEDEPVPELVPLDKPVARDVEKKSDRDSLPLAISIATGKVVEPAAAECCSVGEPLPPLISLVTGEIVSPSDAVGELPHLVDLDAPLDFEEGKSEMQMPALVDIDTGKVAYPAQKIGKDECCCCDSCGEEYAVGGKHGGNHGGGGGGHGGGGFGGRGSGGFGGYGGYHRGYGGMRYLPYATYPLASTLYPNSYCYRYPWLCYGGVPYPYAGGYGTPFSDVGAERPADDDAVGGFPAAAAVLAGLAGGAVLGGVAGAALARPVVAYPPPPLPPPYPYPYPYPYSHGYRYPHPRGYRYPYRYHVGEAAESTEEVGHLHHEEHPMHRSGRHHYRTLPYIRQYHPDSAADAVGNGHGGGHARSFGGSRGTPRSFSPTIARGSFSAHYPGRTVVTGGHITRPISVDSRPGHVVMPWAVGRVPPTARATPFRPMTRYDVRRVYGPSAHRGYYGPYPWYRPMPRGCYANPALCMLGFAAPVVYGSMLGAYAASYPYYGEVPLSPMMAPAPFSSVMTGYGYPSIFAQLPPPPPYDLGGGAAFAEWWRAFMALAIRERMVEPAQSGIWDYVIWRNPAYGIHGFYWIPPSFRPHIEQGWAMQKLPPEQLLPAGMPTSCDNCCE